jgi:ankyrin repeat protein
MFIVAFAAFFACRKQCLVPRRSETGIREQLRQACIEQPQSIDKIRSLVKEIPGAVKTTNVRGLLPLQVACQYEAPLDVIKFLVEQWPDAVKETNQNGFLPLHIACSNKAPLEVIQFLVEQWPDAVKEASLALRQENGGCFVVV